MAGGRRRWDPRFLPNLQCWYRADLGITLAAGFISGWADQSGNARHLSQATLGRQPVVTTGAGGQPTATFNGLSTWLESLRLGTWGAPIAQPITNCAVAKATAQNATSRVLEGSAIDSIDAQHRCQLAEIDAVNVGMYAGASLNGPASVTTAKLWCGVFNGINSAMYVDDMANAIITGDAGADGMDSLEIGAVLGGNGFWWGDVSEFVCCTGSLSLLLRQMLAAYDTTWYGIAAH